MPVNMSRVKAAPLGNQLRSLQLISSSLAHVEFNRQGFVVQCFEDDQSWGYFLTSGLRVGAPTIDINLVGKLWSDRRRRCSFRSSLQVKRWIISWIHGNKIQSCIGSESTAFLGRRFGRGGKGGRLGNLRIQQTATTSNNNWSRRRRATEAPRLSCSRWADIRRA